MNKPAHFSVDPRVATILGENYSSSERALRELIDNAWDAEARSVRITLPAPMTPDPIIVQDDGNGMKEQELRQAKPYAAALEDTDALIDGFQSPLGMELLATVDWLLTKEGCEPEVKALREGLARWSGGADAGQRKQRLFDDRLLELALDRLVGKDQMAAAR